MESIYLKNFLGNVGNAINALNTICVGLSSVSEGKIKKPDELVVKWDPKEPETSSLMSRNFAIKATYVFLAESTYEYMNYVKHLFISENNMKDFHELQNSDKVEKIFSHVITSDNKYRLIMLKLLVHTRNRIVHNRSKADISSKEKDILLESKELIYINHSNLIVDELLQHFTLNDFTLKDVSSHAANNIYMVRQVDKILLENMNNKDIIVKLINEYSINDEWDMILKLEKSETRNRKIKHFLKVYFSFIGNDIIEQIIKEFA